MGRAISGSMSNILSAGGPEENRQFPLQRLENYVNRNGHRSGLSCAGVSEPKHIACVRQRKDAIQEIKGESEDGTSWVNVECQSRDTPW
jgi:hypothetical protein